MKRETHAQAENVTPVACLLMLRFLLLDTLLPPISSVTLIFAIIFSPLHQDLLELRNDQLYEEFQAHKFDTQKK